jgi:hypothetical protein
MTFCDFVNFDTFKIGFLILPVLVVRLQGDHVLSGHGYLLDYHVSIEV